MSTKALTKAKVQAVITKAVAAGYPQASYGAISRRLKMSRTTLVDYLTVHAERFDIQLPEGVAPGEMPDEQNILDTMQFKINALTTQLKGYKTDELNARYVRTKIFGLSEHAHTPPGWLISASPTKNSPGVPTLMASDWHYGEVITAEQVGGVNEYNLEIADQRIQRLIDGTIDLLNNHMVNPKYPGIVFILAGDMVSGDIHDELKETNDIPLIPSVLALFDRLVWCIESLAERFGKVFIPCVGGNHGRNTLKIRHKDRNFTSFDWMLYQMLERHFIKDKRVSFLISGGSDAYYKIYNNRYLITHGDQFRGGDGMIGALGPIIRGDHRKRSRNMQIDMGYDTLVLGHWHQLIQMQRLIVNGSLCGYNEYAYAGNFPFEQPKQGLWITHPRHGITFSMPVNVGESQDIPEMPWITMKDGK